MKKSEFLEAVLDAYNNGRIDERVYDILVENADNLVAGDTESEDTNNFDTVFPFAEESLTWADERMEELRQKENWNEDDRKVSWYCRNTAADFDCFSN